MSSFHPSALIDPTAVVGENVTIGPYAIIGPNVTIGDNSIIEPYARLVKNVTLGARNKVCEHSVLGGAPQIAGKVKEGVLEVGDDNVFREFTTVNLGSDKDQGVTKIGNKNFLMAYCHVGHDCLLGNAIIMANSSHLGGHVVIQDRVFLGGGTLVHQFVTAGEGAFTAGGSILINDLPPYFMASNNPARAVGLNIVGMRRNGMSTSAIRALRKAFRLIIQKSKPLDCEELVELYEYKEVQTLIHFIKNSRRGCIHKKTD